MEVSFIHTYLAPMFKHTFTYLYKLVLQRTLVEHLLMEVSFIHTYLAPMFKHTFTYLYKLSSAKNSGGALTNGGQFHTYILSSYV